MLGLTFSVLAVAGMRGIGDIVLQQAFPMHMRDEYSIPFNSRNSK